MATSPAPQVAGPEDSSGSPVGPGAPGHPSGPSLRPALIVLVVAAVIAVGGAAISLAGGKSAGGIVGGLGRPVPGVSIRAVAATTVIRHIEAAGQPPADIVDNLTVPAGSRYLTSSGAAAPLDQYDRSVTISVGAPASEVTRFYLAELSRARWIVVSDRTASGGRRLLLAQRASSDTYEWFAGITITPRSQAVSPALAGDGQPAVSSDVQIRLQQQGDGS